MPPKVKKQNSRLNSTINIKQNSIKQPKDAGDVGDASDSIKLTKPVVRLEEKSIDEKYSIYELEDYEDLEEEEEIDKLEPVMSRTSLLILDYLQFKAARSIQRFVRGWLRRRQYQRKRKSAIKIQAEWRRFFCQRKFFLMVEQTLQQRIEDHFYKSAQKIQALWRGWWSRQHIHDHTRLMRSQVTAGEDLLYCVAFKLHHLLRTHQIPGIYSLRNSTALSKVEQLLATLSFRSCNEQTNRMRDSYENAIKYGKQKYKKSKYGTEVPFSGPNINNICVPKCMPLFSEKDADRKMARILQMYKDANREYELPDVLKKKSKFAKQIHNISAPTTFCGEVVHSMKKWKIVKENNLKVENNVFEKPENVENFLKEIESKLSFMHDKCNCGQEYLKKKDKPNEDNQSNTETIEEIKNSYIYPSSPAAKLTPSLMSQGDGSLDPTNDCLCFDNQRVSKNTVPARISENKHNPEDLRKWGTGNMGSINSVPTRVSENLNNTEDPRQSGASDKPKINVTEGVTTLRVSAAKGILRNSVPKEVQRVSVKKY